MSGCRVHGGVRRWLGDDPGVLLRRKLRGRATGVDRRSRTEGTAQSDAAALDAELILASADETGLAIQIGVVEVATLALALLGAAERQRTADQAQP